MWQIYEEKLDQLAIEISNLRAITKMALSDSPQQLEKLGILARSGAFGSIKQQPPASDDTDEEK